jgi:hypothetical protein
MNLEECKLYGMKSYNFHVFIQTFISIAYHDLSSKEIWDALMKISYFLEMFA